MTTGLADDAQKQYELHLLEGHPEMDDPEELKKIVHHLSHQVEWLLARIEALEAGSHP